MMILPGIELEISPEILLVHSQHTLSTLSSSLVGGGYGRHRTILNYHVDKSYRHNHPEKELDQIASQRNIKHPYIGMMTAVRLKDAQISIQQSEELSVAAIVTAGLGNTTSAGFSKPASFPAPPGTINMILVFNHMLTPGAMVNAVITATEAKTGFLQQNNIRTEQAIPATGTSTDAIVIAAQEHKPTIKYAGPATTTGWLIGKSVHQTLEKIVV